MLGIKSRPTLDTAFDLLVEKKHQLLTSESASIYFSYLNKLDGLNKAFIQKATNRSFIPVAGLFSWLCMKGTHKTINSFITGNGVYLKPSQVFIRARTSSFDRQTGESKNDGFDDNTTRGLIDYVDYGSEANSFLFRIGVLPYPSAEDLADLLIERQASYFASTGETTDEVFATKLRIYTNCLKQLAAVPNVAQRFNIEPLKSRLISRPWCLGYQTIENSDGTRERIFKIVRPAEVYLDDDHQSAIDLHPLCAPDEPELTKLYEAFGSKWLSEVVQRTLVHKGKFFLLTQVDDNPVLNYVLGRASMTDRSAKLHALIHHRLDMLFVNNRVQSMIGRENSTMVEVAHSRENVWKTSTINASNCFEQSSLCMKRRAYNVN